MFLQIPRVMKEVEMVAARVIERNRRVIRGNRKPEAIDGESAKIFGSRHNREPTFVTCLKIHDGEIRD